jgi:hypothetical protein
MEDMLDNCAYARTRGKQYPFKSVSRARQIGRSKRETPGASCQFRRPSLKSSTLHVLKPPTTPPSPSRSQQLFTFPKMASNVFLRSSLAVVKRPLPFQLGTSTSSVPTLNPCNVYRLPHDPFDMFYLSYKLTHAYTKQHAVQQPTSPTFPVAVRPIFPLLPY